MFDRPLQSEGLTIWGLSCVALPHSSMVTWSAGGACGPMKFAEGRLAYEIAHRVSTRRRTCGACVVSAGGAGKQTDPHRLSSVNGPSSASRHTAASKEDGQPPNSDPCAQQACQMARATLQAMVDSIKAAQAALDMINQADATPQRAVEPSGLLQRQLQHEHLTPSTQQLASIPNTPLTSKVLPTCSTWTQLQHASGQVEDLQTQLYEANRRNTLLQDQLLTKLHDGAAAVAAHSTSTCACAAPAAAATTVTATATAHDAPRQQVDLPNAFEDWHHLASQLSLGCSEIGDHEQGLVQTEVQLMQGLVGSQGLHASIIMLQQEFGAALEAHSKALLGMQAQHDAREQVLQRKINQLQEQLLEKSDENEQLRTELGGHRQLSDDTDIGVMRPWEHQMATAQMQQHGQQQQQQHEAAGGDLTAPGELSRLLLLLRERQQGRLHEGHATAGPAAGHHQDESFFEAKEQFSGQISELLSDRVLSSVEVQEYMYEGMSKQEQDALIRAAESEMMTSGHVQACDCGCGPQPASMHPRRQSQLRRQKRSAGRKRVGRAVWMGVGMGVWVAMVGVSKQGARLRYPFRSGRGHGSGQLQDYDDIDMLQQLLKQLDRSQSQLCKAVFEVNFNGLLSEQLGGMLRQAQHGKECALNMLRTYHAYGLQFWAVLAELCLKQGNRELHVLMQRVASALNTFAPAGVNLMQQEELCQQAQADVEKIRRAQMQCNRARDYEGACMWQEELEEALQRRDQAQGLLEAAEQDRKKAMQAVDRLSILLAGALASH